MSLLARKTGPLEKVLVWPCAQMVEVAPGVKYAPCPVELAPRLAIVRLVPAGDNTYSPKLFIHDHWIRISDAEKLLGIHQQSLYRLINGGFVKGRQSTPNTREISLESYFEHCRKIEDDPDFWQNKDNQRRFNQAASRNS